MLARDFLEKAKPFSGEEIEVFPESEQSQVDLLQWVLSKQEHKDVSYFVKSMLVDIEDSIISPAFLDKMLETVSSMGKSVAEKAHAFQNPALPVVREAGLPLVKGDEEKTRHPVLPFIEAVSEITLFAAQHKFLAKQEAQGAKIWSSLVAEVNRDCPAQATRVIRFASLHRKQSACLYNEANNFLKILVAPKEILKNDRGEGEAVRKERIAASKLVAPGLH